jgi:glucose/arabinose dehydrogenase
MSRVLLLLLCVASVSAHAVDYRIETVAAGLDHPWSLAFLPGGDALVTERAGRLRVIERGRLRAAPVAGVPPVLAAAQAGLFEIAVDPRFAANGFVYLSFAHGSSDANRLRVVRARYAADGLHEVTPIFDAQPDKRGDVHYGARIAFLADETLVIGVGDGFVHREQAQRLDNHLGKLVRITRDGTVPPDNPFARRAGARPEIYSLGHRNPQGLVFDAERGVLYQHEHGPRGGDELNTIRAGANYGWPLASLGLDYTGARISPWTAYPRTEPPRWDWTPSIAPAGLARQPVRRRTGGEIGAAPEPARRRTRRERTPVRGTRRTHARRARRSGRHALAAHRQPRGPRAARGAASAAVTAIVATVHRSAPTGSMLA